MFSGRLSRPDTIQQYTSTPSGMPTQIVAKSRRKDTFRMTWW